MMMTTEFTDIHRYAIAAICKILADSKEGELQCLGVDEQAIASYKKWSTMLIANLCSRSQMSEAEELMVCQIPNTVDAVDLIPNFAKDLQDAHTKNIVMELVQAALVSGVYDARSRSLVFDFCGTLGEKQLSRADIIDIEWSVCCAIQAAAKDSDNKSNYGEAVEKELMMKGDNADILDKQKKTSRNSRYAIMGAAGLAGGVLVGVTGGLAAPLVGAAFASIFGAVGIGGTAAFLTGVGGTALITSLFGATGIGLTSQKMARRVKGVSMFVFVDHRELKFRADGRVSMTGIVEPPAKKWWSFGKNETLTDSASSSTTTLDKPASPTSVSEETVAESSTAEAVHAPFVTISIAGWISKSEEAISPWLCLDNKSELGAPINGEHYSLMFEAKELIALGKAVSNILTSETVGYATGQVLSRTTLAALMAAFMWPAAIVKVFSVLDNPWSVGMERARKSGLVLADILSCHPHGHRPLVLFGSSLGARVIYYCLLELYRRGVETKDQSIFSIVQDVYFIGGSFTASEEEWRNMKFVVSGKIVNAYSTKDWVLGFLFRATNASLNVAGLGPVGANFVNNVDISEVISGHTEYANKDKVPQVIALCGL